MNNHEVVAPETESDLIERMKTAGSQLEITAIYNKHGNGDDARKSCDLIEPDSIVYIEGMRTSHATEGHVGVGEFLHDIALYKRQYGKNDEYHKMKAIVLDETKKELKQTRRRKSDGRNGAAEHGLVMTQLLLEKDCEIIVADYEHVDQQESQEQWDQVSDEARLLVKESVFTPFKGMNAESNVNELFSKLQKIVKRSGVIHELRERNASYIVAYDANRIINNPEWHTKAPRSESGKIKAYLMYGTAHARSLSSRLADMGIQVDPVTIRELPEYRYIDIRDGVEGGNYYRRLAHAAFQNIAIDHLYEDYSLYEKAIDDMYPLMEGINGNRQALIDFCKRCLEVKKKYLTNKDGAMVDYVRLVWDQQDSHLAQQ